jgi:hypothetical protein
MTTRRGIGKSDINKKAEELRIQQRREGHSRAAEKKQRSSTLESRKWALRGPSKRHSKAMGVPRQHVRLKVRIGVRLPASHDEIAGKVAQKNAVLDPRVLCGTSHAEAHVPVRGSVKRAHATADVFSGATVDMLEVLLRTRHEVSEVGTKRVLPSSCSAKAEILAHRQLFAHRRSPLLVFANISPSPCLFVSFNCIDKPKKLG